MWLALTPCCLAALEPANRFSGRKLGFSELKLEYSAANGTETAVAPTATVAIAASGRRCGWCDLGYITWQSQSYAGYHRGGLRLQKGQREDKLNNT